MFTTITRRWRKVSPSSFHFSSRLIFHRSYRSSNHHSHHHSSSSSSSSRFIPRPIRWLAAAVTAFSFKEHGIPEEKLKNNGGDEVYDESHLLGTGWEMLYEEDNLHVYRRKREGFKYETFEYRCQGTYRDISPRHFLDAQNDVSYRSEWDKNVIKLEMVEDDGVNEQLIRWVARYPYPLYPREYVYVRKSLVSEDGKRIVIRSEALPQEIVPLSGNYVRVLCYESTMCVRCHSDIDSAGLDYVLTYFDNPEANIPSYAYNWIVNQAGPYFIKQVYKEARKLSTSGRELTPTVKVKKCPYSPAQTNTTDRDDEDTVGGEDDEMEDEEEERRRVKRITPRDIQSIPGTKLIPHRENGPMRKGAEREGEMITVEEEEEEDKDSWNLFNDEEFIPRSPFPGRRIFA